VASGQEIREPFTDNASAVATATLHGRPILITGDVKGTLRRWDLTTGTRIGDAMSGHDGTVTAITTTLLDGRPIAISGGYAPDAVRVWDLDRGTPIGEPLDGHTGRVRGIDVAEVDGRIVVLTASEVDRSVRIWDLADGSQVGEPLECFSDAVATAVLNGRPVAVTGGGPDHALLIWDLIDRRPVGAPLPGHTLRPSVIATTVADGRPIAISGGYDRTARLWDLIDGKQIGEALTDHADSVTSVAFTALDGSPVAVTASRDNTMLLWDASLTRAAKPSHPKLPASKPQWHVDWATRSGLSNRVALSLPGKTCRTLAAGSLDGRPIVVSGGWNQQLRILDPVTGEQIGTSLTGHDGAVTAAAITTLGTRTVAVTGGNDRTVRIWDLAAGAQVGAPLSGHIRDIRALAVTELDGRPVALSVGGKHTGEGCEVRIWDLAEGREFGEPLTGHTAEVHAIAVAELDGRPVALTASGSFPDKDCTVRVWDLTTRQQIGEPLVGHTRAVIAVSVTLVDGAPVAVTIARDATARVWNLTTRTEIRHLLFGRHRPNALGVTQLGGRAVAITGGSPQPPIGITDSTVRIWDLATGEQIGEPLAGHTDGVAALAVTELHGGPVAVSGGDDSIFVWDLKSGSAPASRPRAGGPGVFVAVAVTELDGREVAVTGTSDAGLAQVWDLTDGAQVGEPIRTGCLSDLAVAELNGRPALVGAPYGEIAVWSLADGSEQARYPTGHRAEVIAVAVGEERGRQVVATGTYDNAVAVHVLETGKRVGRRMRSLHYESVRAAAVTKDDEGRPVAVTVGGDSSAELMVWQLRNGMVISRPRIGDTDDVNAVAVVTRDGRATAVSAGRDKAVRVWHLSDGKLALPPLHGHSRAVSAVAAAVLDGRPTAVSGGEDRTVRVWDLRRRPADRRRTGLPAPRHRSRPEPARQARRLLRHRHRRPEPTHAGVTAPCMPSGEPHANGGSPDGRCRLHEGDPGRQDPTQGFPCAVAGGGGDRAPIRLTSRDRKSGAGQQSQSAPPGHLQTVQRSPVRRQGRRHHATAATQTLQSAGIPSDS
jgi:WD40 repeat protein